MKPEELRKAGVFLYGEHGWQTRLAEALQVDGSTIRRYISGAVPIPGPVDAAVRCFVYTKGGMLQAGEVVKEAP